MFGYYYNKFTDIDQEENGIYKCDRSLKFDFKGLREIQYVNVVKEK